MFDSHIHIGQFRDIYTGPQKLADYLDSVGVGGFAVSSTTICEKDYQKVLDEMFTLVKIAGERVIPVLWLLPEMLVDGSVDIFLNSPIKWRCIKIHPHFNPFEWQCGNRQTEGLLTLARSLSVPILIHTGETAGSYPLEFEAIFRANPDITFIMAHGRPVEQAEQLMLKYDNVWCDTAFMPTENIVRLCNAGLADKVLWGSDYPIPEYFYPEQDMKQYYNSILSELKNSVSADVYDKITDLNARRLLGI